MDEQITDFIKAIEEAFAGVDTKNVWPLNPAQICAYFDTIEALNIYHRINKLKEGLSTKEIAELMPAPDIIRIFLQLNLIVGLKVAKKHSIEDISAEDRTKFVLFLFDILKQKVKNNIFCLDGKNLLMDKEEVKKIISETSWNKPDSAGEKKQISFLIVAANNLCYTLFYDLYKSGGFYIHGPYKAKIFGEDAILIVREYHNINPKELWPDLGMPYKKMRILGIYNGLDIRLNYLNHPVSTTHVGDKLIAYKIYLDDKEINANQIDNLIELFHKFSAMQLKKINAFSDADKIRKGAEISFYLFKRLREYMGDKWQPPAEVEKEIQKYGDKFIKRFKYPAKPSLEHWKRLFNPYDDYF